MKLYSHSALCIILSLLKDVRGLGPKEWTQEISERASPPLSPISLGFDLVPHKPKHCYGGSFGLECRFCLRMVNTSKSLINWFFGALLNC